ncbi:LysM peptidoglycan-binding domain-containing protein [Cognatishimia sp. MH4019]|uniref:CIS tube protein n=1 Tax=Cognatishimia sp. MH4019 TaxID=2854030 RepID=UPI001CD2B641|nr:LysM peptidoglycan-binding domain-containing protein [Cognatishimia sp. MH4019]
MSNEIAKLTITRLKPDGTSDGTDPITVKYAPPELSFSKAAQFADVAIPGLEQPLMQFVRGNAETLSLELFFDSTEGGTGKDATSVTAEVHQLHKLVAIYGETHMPPLVEIAWGDDFPGLAMGESEEPERTFKAVVLSCARRFTLFSPSGKPLRATVTLALKQYTTLAEQLSRINYQSADHTRVHVVQEGETLPLIAHDAYADASKWRVIAAHNDLADVRALTPGDQLELPPLV